MPFSQTEIDNIANAALDFHMDTGKTFPQHIQDKPLLRVMRAGQKTFPGGKGDITIRPIFETQSSIEGFGSDDTLNFTNPTPIKTVAYPWKMIHCGINMTTDELLRDGISVVDTNGKDTVRHSERETTALANILEVKLQDMTEGWSDGMNTMLWGDGTQDAKEVAGIQYFISENPTVGVIGGIDRATQPLWRNIAMTAANGVAGGEGAVTSDVASSALIKALRKKVRQLTRYGKPKFKIMCGADFLDALEQEVDAKGVYTQSGFNKDVDVGIGTISIRGLGTFEYDPTLDVLGKAKFCYFIDTNNIKLCPIEGEDMKKHFPARPHDKMVVYRSVTWAGAMIGRQLNTSMVIEVA